MLAELVPLWWGYILLGVAAGVLSGMLGVGSGTLLIPVLVLVFHLPQKAAQGTCLAVIVPMALMGALRYWGNPDVQVNIAHVCLLAVGAVLGAVAGFYLMGQIPGSILRKIFAVYIIIVGARMLWPGRAPKPAPRIHPTEHSRTLNRQTEKEASLESAN
ncbi:MAG: sulfite exporter TauE/SafE family protein [Planctomycetota bacterium]